MRDQQRDVFEIESVRISESATRSFIAKWVLVVASLFLLAAAAYGAITGSFGALSVVVMFAEAPVFLILGYYFGKH